MLHSTPITVPPIDRSKIGSERRSPKQDAADRISPVIIPAPCASQSAFIPVARSAAGLPGLRHGCRSRGSNSSVSRKKSIQSSRGTVESVEILPAIWTTKICSFLSLSLSLPPPSSLSLWLSFFTLYACTFVAPPRVSPIKGNETVRSMQYEIPLDPGRRPSFDGP